MTRKDFELLARAMKDGGADNYVVQTLADAISDANSGFNREIFYKATLPDPYADDFAERMANGEPIESAFWTVHQRMEAK